MTVKDYEDRYDDAHARWLSDPNTKTAESLDRARTSLWRARNRERIGVLVADGENGES